jgi:copper chaperone
MKMTIKVQNVKCQGCVAAIRAGLSPLPGVSDIAVDVPTGQVTVEADHDCRAELTAALQALGYPESTGT